MRLLFARRLAWLGALVGPWLVADAAFAEGTAEPSPAAVTTPAEPAPAATRADKAKSSTKRSKGRRAASKPAPRAKGSKPGQPDEGVRRQLTGEHPNQSTAAPVESPELEAMRELDRELFPAKKAPPSAPWSTSLALPDGGPEVDASGLPQSQRLDETKKDGEPKRDLTWLTKLKLPDYPVRFDRSVVRYLDYYKSTERGRALLAAWLRKSGRYRASIVKLLRQYQMPEDLVWVALVESAFDPTIHSHAGAAGLWQFMPATGRIYGLTVTKRIDERLDPERSTHAALKHLKDLHKRFGTWELAFAAYNMGYGGLLASMRKYNTNDYWELRKLEAGLPYETALYVPKIMAIAIAVHNCDVFGCDSLQVDPAQPFGDDNGDKVSVAPGVTLDDVAKATGGKLAAIEELNRHVIGSRMPPLEQSTLPRKTWTVYVPEGQGAKAQKELPSYTAARKLGSHRVRWGEPLARIALSYDTTTSELEKLNDLHPGESARPGTVLFVPAGNQPLPLAEVVKREAPVAIVPDHEFAYSDRRRVFYDPVFGDTVEDVARVCGVTVSEIRRWNHLDGSAKLQEGMRLQLFIAKRARLRDVVLLEDGQLRKVTVGSQPFHDHFVGGNGRRRVEVTVAEGETWKKLGDRYGVTLSWLERINHKSRRSKLEAGDRVVVYARRGLAEPKAADSEDGDDASGKPSVGVPDEPPDEDKSSSREPSGGSAAPSEAASPAR
jgi:membrane-bound lytic murein transglycosylase D